VSRRPASIVTFVAAITAAIAVGAGGGAAVYAAFTQGDAPARQVAVAASQPAASTTPLSVSEIYQRSYKSVVEITVTSTDSTPFGGSQSQRGLGSGFVYDTDGHIVTNQHVVDGASSVSVRFWNGTTATARVVATDPSTDLAVIDVDVSDSMLTPLTLADSGDVAVGDGAVAIGSPFGLEETVTSGIVSAVHRQISSPNGFAIDDAIQTDAAINHGNSGGPLLDLQGDVIGVTSQIESDSGGSDGVGFAVPSNTVRSIVSQLVASGKVEHAFLGVSVQTISADDAEQLDLAAGAEIVEVRKGGPADDAGLHGATGSRTVDGERYPTGGDVITAVDGKSIESGEELQRAVGAKQPGDEIELTYVRSGDTHTVKVTLANRPG
jgi:putative serine protease PepD